MVLSSARVATLVACAIVVSCSTDGSSGAAGDCAAPLPDVPAGPVAESCIDALPKVLTASGEVDDAVYQHLAASLGRADGSGARRIATRSAACNDDQSYGWSHGRARPFLVDEEAQKQHGGPFSQPVAVGRSVGTQGSESDIGAVIAFADGALRWPRELVARHRGEADQRLGHGQQRRGEPTDADGGRGEPRRYGPLVYDGQSGSTEPIGAGPDGKSDLDFGGSWATAGRPFAVSGTNVP
ncbi:MAG: hypothetical protein JWP97_969 [Labilithrix sp.]|nr:hypothetical protein [Labilithrix sp.]